MSRLSFTITIFWLTAILIAAVLLRNSSDQMFYRLWSLGRTEKILKQQLWQKQLRLENLTSPATVSRKLTQTDDPEKTNSSRP
jgi:hypothetical protein